FAVDRQLDLPCAAHIEPETSHGPAHAHLAAGYAQVGVITECESLACRTEGLVAVGSVGDKDAIGKAFAFDGDADGLLGLVEAADLTERGPSVIRFMNGCEGRR